MIFLTSNFKKILFLNNQRFLKYFSCLCFLVFLSVNFLNEVYNENISNLINNNVTIFCLIKTHPKNIHSNKTLTVYNVWARKCDNYRFVTLIPKELIQIGINTQETFEVFDKFYMIQPKGLSEENHDNLTSKVYHAMLYVYEKYPNFDWYYIVDDDAYANIKNFKEFLKSKNKNKAITFGYVINVIVEGGYHSGGPGYALSHEAFSRVGSALKKNIKNCPDSGIDDVDVNKCVRNYYGKIGVSCDENNRERFLVVKLHDYLKGNFPYWMTKFGGCTALKGPECCADMPIAFHYMSSEEMIRMDYAMEIYEKFTSNKTNSSFIEGKFKLLVEIFHKLKNNTENIFASKNTSTKKSEKLFRVNDLTSRKFTSLPKKIDKSFKIIKPHNVSL